MSAAIPILRPPAGSSNNPSPTRQPAQVPKLDAPSKDDDSKKLCRNIIIYGLCRFQSSGCLFSHDLSDAASPRTTTPTLSASSAPFSVGSAANAPVFVPTSTGATPAGGETGSSKASAKIQGATTMVVGIPEFVPRRVETPALSEDSPFFTPAGQTSLNRIATPNLGQGVQSSNGPGEEDGELAQYYGQAMDLNGGYELHQQLLQQREQHMQVSEQALYSYNHQGDPSGGPSSYYPNEASHFTRQPIQYHHYHPPPAHSAPPSHSFFLPPSLHTALSAKSEATHAVPSVDMKLPEQVGNFEGLMPLDKGTDVEGGAGGFAGYRSWLYKAWKEDGRPYALRRIEGFRLQHEAAISVVEKWTRVRHPGLVSVREAFTTRSFGDYSIIFVYDFHACSTTLYEAHLSPLASLPPNPWAQPTASQHLHSSHPSQSHSYRSHQASSSPIGVAERVLWSYIVQIGSAVKAVHNAGLAVRNLDVNRILLTGKNRVRIGGCGILDVLAYDGGPQTPYQQDDLLSFGKLIIILACGSTASVHNLPKSVDYISRIYSPDLKNVVLYLLSKPGPRKTIEECLTLMGSRVLEELNASLAAEDTLESELMRELENGRLVRLLTKFGFINERPEFDHDPRWAETGDRYIIKLFRDYVFHQVDEHGRPVTDLSHVVNCLNKLDAGIEEKVMLVSRDEQSCLIVSYREVKNCIESSFLDLSR